jgi:hypothetical protein
MNLSKRLTALEKKAAYVDMYAPEIDPRKELIARINAIAARVEACGEMPECPESECKVSALEAAEILKEYIC